MATNRVIVPLLIVSFLAAFAAMRVVAAAGLTGDGGDATVSAESGSPKKLHFSGALTQNDQPISKGNQSMRFSLWTDATAGTKQWEESQTVNVRGGGVISVFLGAATPFPDGLFGDDPLFLGIELLGTTVTTFPRQELAHVPNAFHALGASRADRLDDEKCAKCVKEDHVQDKVIGKEKIKDKAVGKGQLDDKAVGKGQLGDKAVGKAQLEDQAVGKQQLETGVELDGMPGYSVTALGPAGVPAAAYRAVSATVGPDGRPVIAFLALEGPAVAHCADLGCTSASINGIEGMVGGGPLAIAIGTNGNPIVARGSELATCNDPACTSAVITSIPPNTSALALSARGQVLTGDDNQAVGVASHGGSVRVIDAGGAGLLAEICPSFLGSCNPAAVTLDPGGPRHLSMAINAQGGPMVVFEREFSGAIEFVECRDSRCVAHDAGTLDPDAGGAQWPSVAIGRDGGSVVAYGRPVGGNGFPTLFVAHCSASPCSNPSTTVATFNPTFGPLPLESSPSITIGRDGMPIVAFISGAQLQVLHCSNPFCVPHTRAR